MFGYNNCFINCCTSINHMINVKCTWRYGNQYDNILQWTLKTLMTKGDKRQCSWAKRNLIILIYKEPALIFSDFVLRYCNSGTIWIAIIFLIISLKWSFKSWKWYHDICRKLLQPEINIDLSLQLTEKVYFRSQILEHPSIGEYWNISGVPVLSENVIFMFFRTCWCYSEAYNTGMRKWSSIVQYSCTSICTSIRKFDILSITA